MKAQTSPDLTGKKCPSCGNFTIRDYEQSRIVCDSCGLVLKEEIKDRRPEWRDYDDNGEEEERSRAGPPSTETIHDKGLSTEIDYKNRDAKGNKLSPERRKKVYRLRRWHRRLKMDDAKNRNLMFACGEINRMCSQLGLNKNVKEMAAKIYREAVEEDLIRGHTMEGIASAAFYIACREAEVPRTLEEIAEVSRVGKKKIGRDYRFLSRELDIHLPPTDPARYVARFGSELGISREVQAEAKGIIRKAQEENLTSGKSPPGIAAAAIYLATLQNGGQKTRKQIAGAANVSGITLMNRYKEMQKKLDMRKSDEK